MGKQLKTAVLDGEEELRVVGGILDESSVIGQCLVEKGEDLPLLKRGKKLGAEESGRKADLSSLILTKGMHVRSYGSHGQMVSI